MSVVRRPQTPMQPRPSTAPQVDLNASRILPPPQTPRRANAGHTPLQPRNTQNVQQTPTSTVRNATGTQQTPTGMGVPRTPSSTVRSSTAFGATRQQLFSTTVQDGAGGGNKHRYELLLFQQKNCLRRTRPFACHTHCVLSMCYPALLSGDVSVATRLRPLAPTKETSGGLAIQGNQIFVRPAVIAPTATPRAQVPIGFGFDRVFDDASSQEEVFAFAEDRVLTHFVEGYHGTIFAYGQTGMLIYYEL
jgi:hypothetical protein